MEHNEGWYAEYAKSCHKPSESSNQENKAESYATEPGLSIGVQRGVIPFTGKSVAKITRYISTHNYKPLGEHKATKEEQALARSMGLNVEHWKTYTNKGGNRIITIGYHNNQPVFAVTRFQPYTLRHKVTG